MEKSKKSIGYMALIAAFVILGAMSFGLVAPTQVFADDGTGDWCGTGRHHPPLPSPSPGDGDSSAELMQ